MNFDLDQRLNLELLGFPLNHTILYTWLEMALLLGFLAWLGGRSRSALEGLLLLMRQQIEQISGEEAPAYATLVVSLFFFISGANWMGLLPGVHPPTASLSTTSALALVVFLATPYYGIRRHGWLGYGKHYFQPTPLLVPFHLLSELTRTLALAVRLFGNAMSGGLVLALLLSLAPYFVPIVMQLLELLIGQVQAYIFAVLATVYLASAAHVQNGRTS
ncbi:ATP synthase F0 subunit A [bacterium SCN 62-11]|nr:MAG: ATP synthase F0 subunit A [bacterium SCN 62-11]